MTSPEALSTYTLGTWMPWSDRTADWRASRWTCSSTTSARASNGINNSAAPSTAFIGCIVWSPFQWCGVSRSTRAGAPARVGDAQLRATSPVVPVQVSQWMVPSGLSVQFLQLHFMAIADPVANMPSAIMQIAILCFIVCSSVRRPGGRRTVGADAVLADDAAVGVQGAVGALPLDRHRGAGGEDAGGEQGQDCLLHQLASVDG